MEGYTIAITILVIMFVLMIAVLIVEITYRVKQKKRIERKEIDQVRRARGW